MSPLAEPSTSVPAGFTSLVPLTSGTIAVFSVGVWGMEAGAAAEPSVTRTELPSKRIDSEGVTLASELRVVPQHGVLLRARDRHRTLCLRRHHIRRRLRGRARGRDGGVTGGAVLWPGWRARSNRSLGRQRSIGCAVDAGSGLAGLRRRGHHSRDRAHTGAIRAGSGARRSSVGRLQGRTRRGVCKSLPHHQAVKRGAPPNAPLPSLRVRPWAAWATHAAACASRPIGSAWSA